MERYSLGNASYNLIIDCKKGAQAYQALSAEAAGDYQQIKTAVLKNFKLTPETRRKIFRNMAKERDETYTAYKERIRNARKSWMEANPGIDLEELIDQEKFMDSLDMSLKLYLSDKEVKTLDKMAEIADAYTATRYNTSARPTTQQNIPGTKRCVFCNESHYSDQCTAFSTRSEMLEKLKVIKACFTCLQKGHSSTICTITPRCFHCKKNHHSSLCGTKFNSSLQQTNNTRSQNNTQNRSNYGSTFNQTDQRRRGNQAASTTTTMISTTIIINASCKLPAR